jgi:hypothetical protein
MAPLLVFPKQLMNPQKTIHNISNVPIKNLDNITIKVEGQAKLDYVQLKIKNPFSVPTNAILDDSNALPGQVIVAGLSPGYLKYNGGGPVFLAGPDNPEDFLFRGTLNEDGTRSGGGQEKMIERMAEAGVNAFHCQMFRMRRCNIKDEGDDSHGPFVDFEPSKGLNQDILNQ